VGLHFRVGLLPVGRRLDPIKVNVRHHALQKVADLCRVSKLGSTISSETAYRASVPSPSTNLEPGEMASQGGSTENGVGVLLELSVRYSFLNGNLSALSAFMHYQEEVSAHGIILCGNGEEGNLDGQNSIARRGISIVSCFCWIAPCNSPGANVSLSGGRALLSREGILHLAIKLMKATYALNLIVVELSVFQNGIFVISNELLHVC
jgi:hypothetical protein